ncbi:PREDICTED: uncharacterized protein LOC108572778 [Habropoda laboriosa]|uniref:uncharacterized protein LOC108572778 n=1 Tax=Habropoda laboriosa TaxID=597456 RepID=UPI00083DF783|nr:PREDICTED: uncharacterized protein LOC108572778 [Habropoda laboriosa]
MDERILKSILCSCESVTKDLENSKDYKKLLEEDKFLPTSNDILNALCTSLTNLLSYKVSKEAYQRYTVRLHVINVLRDWCRINDALQDFEVLRDEKHTSTLLKTLLEKYLTDDILDSCDSTDSLLSLTSALMCLAPTNSYCKSYVEKVLLKLVELGPCDQSKYLLCYAVQRNSNLNLEISTIEKIYQSQKCKLIEQPLLDDFISSCSNLNKDNDVNNSESINLINQLFEFVSKSSHIFLLVCGFLKELQVELDHAPTVIKFIQSTLKRIKEYCENQGKDILDLYPRNLQSLVILLRIEPMYHTDDSKSATLKMLKHIYTEEKDTAITLLSHFSQWLNLFGVQFLNSDIR